MAEGRVERRLAAILAGDVAGYSRLMGTDEEGTLQQLQAHRRELVDPKIVEHRGRIVKTTGDGMLVEFVSVVDAVRCAVDIQRGMAERNAEVPADKRIDFRVGINVGDIISDANDIYGDGVNVAARLEALADPGGIMVSRNVFDQVRDKLSFGFEDMGEQTVKNIARPIGVHRVSIVESAATITVKGAAVSQPAAEIEAVLRRPAVAVLPFDNLTRDPEQEYFSDGLTEDIITALSLWRTFPVIARNSTFTYKGRAVKVQVVAKELSARYIIEGSVRKGGDRVRVAVQLIDADTGHHLWAERYDRKIDDIFALQDEITERIATTVAPELERAERQRSGLQKPSDLQAWDYYLRGMAFLHEFAKEGNQQAREMFERAVALDPTYVRGHAGIAYSHYRDAFLALSDDPERSVTLCVEAAQRAVSLDDTDAFAHFVMSRGLDVAGRIEQGLHEARLAIELNPNDAMGYGSLGYLLISAGQPDEGITALHRAHQLSPKDPRSYLLLGMESGGHFLAGRFDEAAKVAKDALNHRPGDPALRVLLVASLSNAARDDEACSVLAQGGPIESSLFGQLWVLPWFKGADRERLLEGLRKAGWAG